MAAAAIMAGDESGVEARDRGAIGALLRDLAPARAALEGLITEGLSEGRRAWPTARLDAGAFARAVLAHVRDGADDPLADARTLRLSELYLATACGAGDAGAIAAFEASFFDLIPRAFRRARHDPAFLDDARQNLREKLFLSSDARPAEILRYGARGSLRGWFRVVLVHHTLNDKRKEGAVAPVDDDAVGVAATDPELAYLKARYASEFSAAAEDAARSLTREERLMLAHHYLERLTIDQIGAVYGIHRVTASRRVNSARALLVRRVREALAHKLRLAPAELESLLRLLPTQLSLSLPRLLAPA